MNAAKTGDQQRGKPWPRGVSGNPKGRREGSRNKATIALQAILTGEGEAIVRKVVELALEGDSTALRLCLELLVPPARERCINVRLPKVVSVAEITMAIGAVLEAVGRGDVTPSEGQAIAVLLEVQRRAIETMEMDARISKLERVVSN